MTPEIQSAIANSTRLNPAARRAMVRELVDQIRVHNANPNRGICLKVVNDIIQKYPTCFGDVDDDENTVGASLVQKVKTRIEHVNRNNTLARLRKNKHSNRQARTNGRGPVDQYGCVRWAPQELPSGETDETLQEMKTQMQQLYAQVNWEKMTPEIQSAIANSTRLNPAARRAMVRELVDQIRVHNANPNRGICLKVVNDIIQKYPTCFGDVDDDENTVGASLVQKVKTRIEHVNRNNTLARLRKNKHSNRQARTNGRGPVDQYGCVRWAPQELPSGETDETLQEMKTQMQQLYAQGLFSHFSELTGIPIQEKLTP
ncbi:unnamed protein product [Leuciscus chuanchicus]